MDRDRLLVAAPLLAASIRGGMYVASKWGLRPIPPPTLVFLGIAPNAGVFHIVVRMTTPARSFDRSEWWRFAALAVWLTAALSAQFVGTDLTNASQGSLLTVSTPVFMLVLGVTALGEHLTRWRSFGTALAVVGTLVVLSGQCDAAVLAGGSVPGVALLLFPLLCFAALSVFAKLLIRRYSAPGTATYATVLSVPLFGALVPVELYLDPAMLGSISPSLPVVGVVLYPGPSSIAAARCCWYKGVEYADASVVGVFFFTQPVVDIPLGVVFLHEPVSLELFDGGAVPAVGALPVNTD